MALIIPGGVVAGAPSGSVGAVVFSHGRSGSYMRTKVIPTNPKSAAQVLARNRMSALSNFWYNGLTSTERAGWDTYAANVPVTNRIGQQIYLTGMNWYIGCNSLRDQAGGTITWLADAPTIFNLASFNIISASISEAAQTLATFFETGDDWNADDGAVLGYMTRPQNASVNFNNLPYRYADTMIGDTAVPLTSPQQLAIPFPVVEGQRVFVRFNCINPDGRIGAEQRLAVDVAA